MKHPQKVCGISSHRAGEINPAVPVNRSEVLNGDVPAIGQLRDKVFYPIFKRCGKQVNNLEQLDRGGFFITDPQGCPDLVGFKDSPDMFPCDMDGFKLVPVDDVQPCQAATDETLENNLAGAER